MRSSGWAPIRLTGVIIRRGFPGDSDGKESACSARDLDLIPMSGRSPGEGYGNPLQYSCLEITGMRTEEPRGLWFMGWQRFGCSKRHQGNMGTEERPCVDSGRRWHLQTKKKGIRRSQTWDFPGGPVVKNSPSYAGHMGSILG